MKLDIECKINNTCNLLRELGNSVSYLVNSSPDIFNDPGIKSCLEDFTSAYQEAVERLKNPSFRIATLGTTSSGKSTIVNALIGRKIAPIEAGEMSGGVLTIKHSQTHRLIIDQTDNAAWDTGEWTGLSDEDLYQRIRTVMHSYHDARKKREYVAPQITAYVPLLPACNSSLLGLPKGIELELIDLPGLKSVQDRANLAIIQKQVNKAFSLVALDYMQVDDHHRKRLLEELKKVVEYLQGRTDSMIFILNRVDQRGADDLPLEVRVNKLRREIQEVLSLPELPDVLPFNARLLYYAQCAWGSGAFNERSKIDQQTRLKFIQAMFEDCAGVIKLNSKENRDLKNWFRSIEDQIEDKQPIDDGTMQQILGYSFEWSGGKELWERLRARVQESFTELVIFPALVNVFANYSTLSECLDILIQTRQIYNEKQVKEQRKKLDKIRSVLHESINDVIINFKKEIENFIVYVKHNDPQDHLKIDNIKDKEIFFTIFKAVSDVEGDLTDALIVPARDAFKDNKGSFELRDKLQEVISPSLADDIAKAYDNVSRRISQFSRESEYLVKRVRSDSEKAQKEFEHDERYVRLLYHTMREAISARAEFILQGKAKQFEQALESLVNKQIERLEVCLSENNLDYLISFEKAAISDLRRQIAQKLLTLPRKFFEISDTIKQNRYTKTEVVGEEKRDESYTHYEIGSCYTKPVQKTRTVTYDITEDVEYIELFLPSPDLMAKQWLDGIEKGKERLWDILQDWIIERLDDVQVIFEDSVKDITNLAGRALDKQLSIIKDNFENEKQLWRDFKINKDSVTNICQQLEEYLR